MIIYKNKITGRYFVSILRLVDKINNTETDHYYDTDDVEFARQYSIGEDLKNYIKVDYLTEVRKQKLKKLKNDF